MNWASSSTVASQLTARYPWPSCSVTQGPTMWTPRIRPGPAVRSTFGDDLHQAVGVPDDLGTAVAAVGILLHHDVIARCARSALAETGERNLGVGVDAPGNPVVVDRQCGLSENPLDRDYSLGESDVGELWSVDDIADGPDPGLAGSSADGRRPRNRDRRRLLRCLESSS